jgi:hypothetical protein
MKSMYGILVIVLLLVFEFKDFYYNGGVTNSHAFNVIKITI